LAEAKENSPANVMFVMIGTHLDEADKYKPHKIDDKYQKKRLIPG